MRNKSRLLISLALAALPLVAAPLKPALAEEILGPGDAAAHLARAHGAAEKCGHLTAGLRNELSDYVNMAEVVAAVAVGPEEIVRLIEEGRQQGRQMTCGAETEELAFSAVNAAREALHQADGGVEIRDTIADAPVVEPVVVEQEQAARVIEPEQPARQVEQESQSRKAARNGADEELIRYAQATAAYYVERRCQHLGGERAIRFWQQVVSRHNAMLSRHDRAAVAQAKARAISMAEASGSCGNRTRRMVSAGVSLVASN
jgi:hypothetical protein